MPRWNQNQNLACKKGIMAALRGGFLLILWWEDISLRPIWKSSILRFQGNIFIKCKVFYMFNYSETTSPFLLIRRKFKIKRVYFLVDFVI